MRAGASSSPTSECLCRAWSSCAEPGRNRGGRTPAHRRRRLGRVARPQGVQWACAPICSEGCSVLVSTVWGARRILAPVFRAARGATCPCGPSDSEHLTLVRQLSPDQPPDDLPDPNQSAGLPVRRSWPGRTGRWRDMWRGWIGAAISAVFLILAFRGQDLGEVSSVLRRIHYGWLVPALAFYFAGVWVRAVRWSVLLRPLMRARGRDLFPVVIAGYTANNVLPLRTGEVVRAYLLGRRFGVRKTAALATIAVERLFDGLTMLVFMLAAAGAISFTAELRRLALVAFLLFTIILVGLGVVVLAASWRERLLRLALGPLPQGVAVRVERAAESFLSGLGVLRRRRDLVLVAGASLLAWTLEAAMYWTIARGFGQPLVGAMGLDGALLTTGVANLATLVPASPGYVGTFEAGVTLAIAGALELPRGLALSYAIVVHAALWLPVTLVGAVAWWRLAHLSSQTPDGIESPSAIREREQVVEMRDHVPVRRRGMARR